MTDEDLKLYRGMIKERDAKIEAAVSHIEFLISKWQGFGSHVHHNDADQLAEIEAFLADT